MAKGGFRGGMPGSQANMMKQAQKMQQEFMKMQQELESTPFEFTAGGGAVKAVIIPCLRSLQHMLCLRCNMDQKPRP